MAYQSPKQKLERLDNKVSDHDKEIAEQKVITKFFIIVVAATLVATLVGLGGLYISAFKDVNSYPQNIDMQLRELRDHLGDIQKGLYENKSGIDSIRAKNPYLK